MARRSRSMVKPDDTSSEAEVRVLSHLVETLTFGLRKAGEIGANLLSGRSLAIWEKALTEGPPEALDVTLVSLRLPDQVAQEANIIWAPAASLAAAPRHGYGSLDSLRALGHVTRPRMHFCQTISWIHLCLILCRYIKPIGAISKRFSRQHPASRLLARATRRARTHKRSFTSISKGAGRDIPPTRPNPGARSWLG